MNAPKRLTVWTSAKSDPIRASWLVWLLTINLAWSVGEFLGLVEFSSPTLSIIGTCLLVVSIALIAFGFSLTGAGVGLIAWSAFTCAVLAGPRPDFVSLVLAIGMVGWHVLILINVGTGQDEEREEHMRRP